jgi:hypothetical protein
VSGPDGNWHESLRSDGPAKSSTDRSFGLLFAGICGFLGVLALWERKSSAPWWLVAALAFLIAALYFTPLLRPLNRLWRRFAQLLNTVVNPLIMAVMFYAVVTPAGLLMRLFGKDPLRLRLAAEAPSYWIDRQGPGGQPTSMNNQF